MKAAIASLVGLSLFAQNGVQGMPQAPAAPAAATVPAIYYFAPPADVNSRTLCQNAGESGSYTLAQSTAGLITHKDKTNLCVYFVGVDSWFFHKGSVGNIGMDGCSEWLPPPSNNGTKPSPLPIQPFRWAPAPDSGDCAALNVVDTIEGVPLAKGQDGKTGKFCFNPKSDKLDDSRNVFHLVEGKQTQCGTEDCCPWFFDVEAIYQQENSQ